MMTTAIAGAGLAIVTGREGTRATCKAAAQAQDQVVQQINNFSQIVDQRAAQIVSDYQNGNSTPASLQADLQNYSNPPGGTGLEQMQSQQGALNNIESYVAGRLKTEIQGEVNSIVKSSTKAQLFAFSGRLAQADISNQPGPVGAAAQKAVYWGFGKVLDHVAGAAGEFVGYVLGALVPESNTVVLMRQAQAAIAQQLGQLP
jgi:hypothetical protein